MSFDRPLVLLTLLAVPAPLGLYVLLRRRPSRYVVRFPNMEVVAMVAPVRLSRRAWTPPALLLLALASLCAAVARPHVQRTVANERATVVLVLDTSRSMLSDDVTPRDSRRRRARPGSSCGSSRGGCRWDWSRSQGT